MSLTPKHVLVYDVGGSHVSAAVCAEQTYELRGLSRAPLPNQETGHFSSASFCRLIHTLGEAAAKSAGLPMTQIAGAGLAMPGPFDYANGISQMTHKLHSLFGVDLKAALGARFGWQPAQLRFVNDAAAFTLGEVGAGAAKGFSRSIGITLGTGIGCAFAVDTRIADSSPTNTEGVPPGGEIWNLPFQGAIVEDFVSTRFLRHQFQQLAGPGIKTEPEVTEIAEIAKGNQPCPEIDPDLAPEPDQNFNPQATFKSPAGMTENVAHCHARQAFLDFGRNLGLALNQHATAFAPDVIVLGGGIARASNLFLPATRKALIGIHAKIVISTLMDEAPLAGAGVHWFTAA